MAKRRTIPTRIVVPGVRTPTELGASTNIGKMFLISGDPSDVVRELNKGFKGDDHVIPGRRKIKMVAQDKNAIFALPIR